MTHRLLALLGASLLLAACSPKEEAAAPTKAGEVKSFAQAPNNGKVLQVQQAGQYTYAEVETRGQRVWIAGGHIEIKAGDEVQWGDYSVMRNFNAKSLGKTFDQILFVSAWGLAGKPIVQVAQHGAMPGPQGGMAPPAAHPPMAGHPPMAQGAAAPTAGAGNSGVAKSVATAGGYTYVEVAQGSGSVWIAVPETKVAVGDKVTWSGGATMQNFNAKSLNRTFERIVFAGGLNVVR